MKKKKNRRFIIPASHFKNKGIEAIQVVKPESLDSVSDQVEEISLTETKIKNKESEVINSGEEILESAKKIAEERPKILLNQEKKRTSGLSLKSIKAKKEHLIRQMEVVLDEEEQPTDNFTSDQLIKSWNGYIKKLETQGKFNLASILSIDTPKVQDSTIHLEYPNSTNKVEIERHQYELLGYIRKELNNFNIDLSITVNEGLEKQYAYTPKEKYDKLKKKNPHLDILRRTFDLDI